MDKTTTPNERKRVEAIKAIAAMYGLAPLGKNEAIEHIQWKFAESKSKADVGDVIGATVEISLAALIAVANNIPDDALPVLSALIESDARMETAYSFKSRKALWEAGLAICRDLLMQPDYDHAQMAMRIDIMSRSDFREVIADNCSELENILTVVMKGSEVMTTTASVVAESMALLQSKYHEERQKEIIRTRGEKDSKDEREHTQEWFETVKKHMERKNYPSVIVGVYADVILMVNASFISARYLAEAESIMRHLEVVSEASERAFHFFRLTVPKGAEIKKATKEEIAKTSLKYMPSIWKRDN